MTRRCNLSNRRTEEVAMTLACPSCESPPDHSCRNIKPDETGRQYSTTTHVPRLKLAKAVLAEVDQFGDSLSRRRRWQLQTEK